LKLRTGARGGEIERTSHNKGASAFGSAPFYGTQKILDFRAGAKSPGVLWNGSILLLTISIRQFSSPESPAPSTSIPPGLSSHFRRNPGTARPTPLEAEARNVGGTNCSTKPQHQKAFAQETAEKTGRPKRDINRKVARAEAIPDIERVAGTSLDKGVELDALAKMGESDREDIIAKAQAGERVSARMSGASKRA
jgi:hypothetical protein